MIDRNLDPVSVNDLRPGGVKFLNKLLTGGRPKLETIDAEYAVPKNKGGEKDGRVAGLALDFGTSAIAVAIVQAGNPIVLGFPDEHGRGWAPFLQSTFALRRTFSRSKLQDNYRFNPKPVEFGNGLTQRWGLSPYLKRRIEWYARSRNEIDWEKQAIRDVTATTQYVVENAQDEDGRKTDEFFEPPHDFKVHLSIPNAFPAEATKVIVRGVALGVAAALKMARLPEVEKILEAEAVAYHAVSLRKPSGKRKSIRNGQSVLVIDAGAGTTDVSLVRFQGEDPMEMVAHAGLPVGGLDLDALIVREGVGIQQAGDDLPSQLRRASELKIQFWGAGNESEQSGVANRELGGLENLTERILRMYPIDGHAEQRKRIQRLLRGRQRYLALAIDALLHSIQGELMDVALVVLSGRASQLYGFKEAVEKALLRLGIDDPGIEIQAAEASDERKLAVVRGIGDSIKLHTRESDRKPLRAGFQIEVQLTPDSSLCLVRAGSALVDGWAVASWRVVPVSQDREWWPVFLKLLPEELIEDLIGRGLFEDHQVLDLWSSRLLYRLSGRQTKVDTLAYDSLTDRYAGLRDRASTPFELSARKHPVHGEQENWFERYLGVW